MTLRAILLAAACATTLSGASANDLEDWVDDCKGEPGLQTLLACSHAIDSGNLDTPLLVRLLTYRAESYVHEQQFAAAIADADRALALAPDNADAAFVQARALGAAGRTADALAAYDRLIAAKPDEYFLYESRAIAAAQGRLYDIALADLDHALALAPGMPKPFLERALLTLAMKRFDLAAAAFETAMERWPKNPAYAMAAGQALMNWRDGPPDRLLRARRDVDAALALAPDNVQALRLRGDIEAQLGDAAAASADRARADRLAPPQH